MLQLFSIGVKSFLGGGTLPVLLLAGAVSLFLVGYGKGRLEQAGKCHQAALEQTVISLKKANDRLKQQATASAEARRIAANRAFRDASEIQILKEKASAFEQDIDQRQSACALSDADARQLQQLK